MENFLVTNINSSELNQMFSYMIFTLFLKEPVKFTLWLRGFQFYHYLKHFEGRVLIVLTTANLFHNARLLNDVKLFVHVNNILRTQTLIKPPFL